MILCAFGILLSSLFGMCSLIFLTYMQTLSVRCKEIWKILLKLINRLFYLIIIFGTTKKSNIGSVDADFLANFNLLL